MGFLNNEDGIFIEYLEFKLWNPVLKQFQHISLDKAIGKVIMSTNLSPYDDNVTIYLRDNERPI